MIRGGSYPTKGYWLGTWLLAFGLVACNAEGGVPILVYHRFAPIVRDSMTVRTATFEAQLRVIAREGYHVIPLRQAVEYLAGTGSALPPKAVVITADDGHESIYREMLPRIRAARLPVTLFIYPSAISNASYAMTWQQLAELKRSGLFDIQSHTYWHPNFRVEKHRRSFVDYRAFVHWQLARPKALLAQRLGGSVVYLAWPFGIVDDELMQMAREEGYIAGFTLDPRPATRHDRIFALPRYLMVDRYDAKVFSQLLRRATEGERP
jgi:peptidoglycan/xylan/chitin deacetylase (PgdA/CDA1 family)